MADVTGGSGTASRISTESFLICYGDAQTKSPWTIMSADDIVICSENRKQVEENLERLRYVLDKRGMKVSHSKTKYMCVNEKDLSGTVRLQEAEMEKVEDFKYLGSTLQSN